MRGIEEQQALLTELISIAKSRQEAGETEWLEMKTNISESHASITYEGVGKYLSGLSNGACVQYKDSGYLVLGVEDGTWNIVGTNLHMTNAKFNQQDYELWLRRNLSPMIHFTIEDFDWDEHHHVVIFEIPAAQGVPPAFKNEEYIRIGSNLTKLKDFPEYTRQIYNSAVDWSAQIVHNATLADLDPNAIKEARARYIDRHKHLKEEVPIWTDEQFLNNAKITRKGQITNAAIVLLGKAESEVLISPAVSKIKWILKDNNDTERDYDIQTCPMILAVDKIYHHIRNLTYRRINPAYNTLTPDELLTYEPYVLREAINNAIAHQDYSQGGVINIVEYFDRIVISNLGSFIPGSVQNILQSAAPQEKYRNPFLVNAMVELKLVDTIGSGIRKICEYQKERFFPMPYFDLSNNRVVLTIIGSVVNEQYALQLAVNESLTLSHIEMLSRLQVGLPLSDMELHTLKNMKVLEGRKNNLQIVGKQMTVDEICIQQIRNLLAHAGYISKAKIEPNVMDIFPESLTDKQKKEKISNILKKMKKKGVIDTTGKGPSAQWYLVK